MRKTGNQYLKEYRKYIANGDRIEREINDRLKFLIKSFPDAIITFDNHTLKASVYTSRMIETYSLDKKIGNIIEIEKWLEEQQQLKQLKLFK